MLDTIKTAIDALARVKKIAEEAKYVEFAKAIADADLALARLQVELAQTLRDKSELERKLHDLLNQHTVAPKLVKRGNAYYLAEPFEGKPEGPYCMACRDQRSQLILMEDLGPMWPDGMRLVCKVCK